MLALPPEMRLDEETRATLLERSCSNFSVLAWAFSIKRFHLIEKRTKG
jgi:hypothetical protein